MLAIVQMNCLGSTGRVKSAHLILETSCHDLDVKHPITKQSPNDRQPSTILEVAACSLAFISSCEMDVLSCFFPDKKKR